jgi:hypothetical protein
MVRVRAIKAGVRASPHLHAAHLHAAVLWDNSALCTVLSRSGIVSAFSYCSSVLKIAVQPSAERLKSVHSVGTEDVSGTGGLPIGQTCQPPADCGQSCRLQD